MATAENAKIEFEGGQSAVAMHELTDSGDQTTYTSTKSTWSRRSGFAPVIRPNGLLTGGAVIPAAAAGTDDVDVASLTCNLQGVVTSVSADTDVAITRPATDVSKVNSITVDSGGTIAVVVGTDGSTTAFSETRATAGGPPLIPVDSIEIAQVRVTASAAAVIDSTEINDTTGLHKELAISPSYNIDYSSGEVEFIEALDTIHTGTVAKKVYASYAGPTFAEIDSAGDFVPPENSHSTSSKQIYNKTIGSSSTTLNQGSFTAYLNDGITDDIVTLADEYLWFRFYPDRYNSPYILCQGKLGVGRTFPADDLLAATCTISAEQKGTDVAA